MDQHKEAVYLSGFMKVNSSELFYERAVRRRSAEGPLRGMGEAAGRC